MSLDDLIQPFPWTVYSKKIADKIKNPFSCGIFLESDAEKRKLRMVKGESGSPDEGNFLILYLLVDPKDGMILDAKFQAFGHTALLAAAEAFCMLIIGKYISQATRISAELIDKQLREKIDTPALPFESYNHLNLVLEALDQALSFCKDISEEEQYHTPFASEINSSEGYPGWKDLSKEKKKSVIEKVLAEEVRPYIELDAGGIELLDIVGDHEVVIAYKGSCTSCFSAIGSTLAAIQQTLQAKVHPEIAVIPNTDNLAF